MWRGDNFRVVFAYDPNVRTWGGNVIAWVDASLARREMRPYRRELQDSNPLSPGSSHLQPGPI